MASSAADKSRMAVAWKLFEEGDKRAARAAAQQVLDNQPTEKEAAEAKDLLGRLKPPRFGLLMAAVVLVCALILIEIARHLLE